MIALTEKQRSILDFIKSSKGMPSYRTIQRQFAYASVSTVAGHIAALKKKGYLPLRELDGAQKVPIIGIFHEGKPLELNLQTTSFVWSGKSNETLYALQVQSCPDFEEGDILIIAASSEPVDHAPCLVEIDGVVLFRRTIFEGPYIRLGDRIFACDDVVIRARVIELIRRL